MNTPPPRIEPPPFSAVVLGSSGNVGHRLVELLITQASLRHTVLLNRRATGVFAHSPKVHEIVVSNLNNLAAETESAARAVGATVAFCAVGVGQGSRRMPTAEVRKVEVEYPEAFARGCHAAGVLALGLMTAAGANGRSSIDYVRIMGQKEDVVTAVGVPFLGLYKPSVILGNTHTPSYLHHLMPALQWMLPSSFHAIHKNDLAQAMVTGTLQGLDRVLQGQRESGAPSTPEVRRYEYREMKPLFRAAT